MNALVTGGGGFLGKAIVRRLLARGDRVRILARGNYAELTPLGVDVRRGDVADEAAVVDAIRGCDVVFHVAARPGVWGPPEAFHRTNVIGTMTILRACRKLDVRRLVYTSSPSVIFDGADQQGVDESVPYPSRYEAIYPLTKAIAERAVLAANGPELATTALRPHLIWGPGDNHLVPRLLARARAGRLWMVGGKPHYVDTTYIDDAAEAHLLAADRLAPGSPIAGRPFFISQGQPVLLWEFIDQILESAGLPPVRRRMPAAAAYALGWWLEFVYAALAISAEPPMTRFLARQLSTAHWFNIDAARRDLGYAPQVSLEEGVRRLAESHSRSNGR